jgi:hypothetical protein
MVRGRLSPPELATFTIMESHNTYQKRTITSRIFSVASLTGTSHFLFWRMGVVSFAIFISLACGFPTRALLNQGMKKKLKIPKFCGYWFL